MKTEIQFFCNLTLTSIEKEKKVHETQVGCYVHMGKESDYDIPYKIDEKIFNIIFNEI